MRHLSLFALVLFRSIVVSAQELPPLKIYLTLIDLKGNVSQAPWPYVRSWIQKPSKTGVNLLQYQISFSLPKQLKLIQKSVANASEGSQFNLSGPVTVLNLVNREQGDAEEGNLIIQMSSPATVISQINCETSHLTLKNLPHATPPLFVQVDCSPHGSTKRLSFQYSNEMTLSGEQKLVSSVDANRVELAFDEQPESSQTRTTTLILKDREQKNSTFSLQVSPDSSFQKNWVASVGLGVSSLSFSQTGIQDLSELLLTIKFSVTRLLSERWKLGFSGFYNPLILSKNQPDPGIQFLGLNLRASWETHLLPEPWNLSLSGGYYYTTSFVSDISYGYANLQGPQFYPNLSRKFERGDSAGIYFKFSPVTSNFQLLNLSNREIAAGLTYSRPVNGNHQGTISLDLANIQLNPYGIQNRTYSLGLGYSL